MLVGVFVRVCINVDLTINNLMSICQTSFIIQNVISRMTDFHIDRQKRQTSDCVCVPFPLYVHCLDKLSNCNCDAVCDDDDDDNIDWITVS